MVHQAEETGQDEAGDSFSVPLPPPQVNVARLAVGLAVVGLHLDHVAGLDVLDALQVIRRQDGRPGDEADDGEVGT